MVSTGTSPHVKMQDYYVIPLDESPLAHSPGTPLMTPRESRNVLFEGLSPIQCITFLNLDRHFWRTVEELNLPCVVPRRPTPTAQYRNLGLMKTVSLL